VEDSTVAFQGWNASGVGWGEDPWGESLADLPTGTGQAGAVSTTADANVPLTGVSALVLPGQVTVTANAGVNATGVSGQGQVGAVFVWGVIDDNQSPNWQEVNDSQAQNWGIVDNAQAQNWLAVNDAQAQNWLAVNDGNTVSWTQVTK
jgi:hypothetical protein